MKPKSNNTIPQYNPLRLWWMERILWWRSFLPIVFAHKPLCERFRSHTIRIGKINVCRSCTIMYTSIGLSALLFFALGWHQNISALWVSVIVLMTVVLSFPPLYGARPRWLKDVIRASLGVSIVGIGALLIQQHWGAVVMIAGVMWVSKIIFQTIRKRRMATACDGCPEYASNKICSGYRLKAQRMRLYERVLTRRILNYQQKRDIPDTQILSGS